MRRRPNDAKATSWTYTLNNAITSLQSKLRQGFNQEGQRDLEGIYLCSQGDLHADGLEHLSSDETSPHLCEYDDLLTTPDQMQSQFPFERQERQFDIPTPRVEPSNLPEGQDSWITDISEVLPQFTSLSKLDLPHDIFALDIPSSQPHQSIKGFSDFIIGVQHHHRGVLFDPRDPTIASVCQFIKPPKAEVA